jgi:hypothetical protein
MHKKAVATSGDVEARHVYHQALDVLAARLTELAGTDHARASRNDYRNYVKKRFLGAFDHLLPLVQRVVRCHLTEPAG